MFKKRLLPAVISLSAASLFGSVALAQESTQNTQAPPTITEEILVQGVRQAELNARESERNKKMLSNIIAQDDAGNFADQNVAESLQRLPGITLQKSEGEGKFVTIRGLGPGFVSVSMNGSEMANAGDDDKGRGVALDAIPADLLGGIEVFKVLLPSMDLNSIGGAVNVKSVSAFDKKTDSLKVSGGTYYQDFAGEQSPKLTLQGTNLFADDTFGVAYSLAWEKRNTHSYEVLHHEEILPRYIQQDLANFNAEASDPGLIIPFEVQNRQEVAERKKLGATLGLEFRPTDTSEYAIRGSYTSLQDLDLAWREYFRFGQAVYDPMLPASGEIAFVNPSNSTFGVIGGDVQQQMFIQDGKNKTTDIAFSGKNIIETEGGDWTAEYEVKLSNSVFDKPDGRRAQLRVREVPIVTQYGKEFITSAVVSPQEMAALAGIPFEQFPSGSPVSGYGKGLSASSFKYDNLFIETNRREDDLNAFRFDLTKDFSDGMLTYIKTGVNIKNRERTRDVERWSLDPKTYNTNCDTDECRVLTQVGDLSQFNYEPLDHPAFVYPAITLAGAEHLIETTRVIANEGNKQGQESNFRDYRITEDTIAAYLEAELQWNDIHSLIIGARWDKTDFNSTGAFTINNESFSLGGADAGTISLDYSIPLENAGTKYSNLLPSVHYRLDLDEVQVRSSLWTSFVRPSFDEARAFADIENSFTLCNPATGLCSTDASAINNGTAPTQEQVKNFTLASSNTIGFGDPTLDPMTSTNFDTSISWYASDDLYFQAAFFYKDIKNFIARANQVPLSIDQLALQLPVDQVQEFIIPTNQPMLINTHVNGDSAQVFGIELSYTQSFENGLFVQSNATFMTSEATLSASMGGDTIALPDQADQTGNLVFGWENDIASARISGNYRSKILSEIGIPALDDQTITLDSRAGDIYQGDTFSLDFKATYQITDDLKISFDALNLTDDYSVYYFQGNEASRGSMLYKSELFGRSVQLGINYKIM